MTVVSSMASSGCCARGAPWRDLPDMFGLYTTCYNRFVRWRRAGVWGRIIDALAAAHDAAVQMIDTSIVRVHQHGACITRNQRQSMGRSRGGLTSKIHAVVDSNGLPVRLALSPGEAHDVRLAEKLLSRLKSGSMLLADRGYDADWIRELAMKKGAWAIVSTVQLRVINQRSEMSTEQMRPPPERRSHVGHAALRRSSICWAFVEAVPISIRRGFIASGSSRTRSMVRRPSVSLAPATFT